MSTLLLRLAAPLQAWGCNSKFNIRTTEREPTKSGVIGMISAALGIPRNDESDMLGKLSELRFGVRVEREGKLLKDFHMVHEVKDSHVTERYYLSDAVFLVALESDDNELLTQISKAVLNPVYPLFLGRRSCPVTLPVYIGMREDSMLNVLKNEKRLVDSNDMYCRIEYESSDDGVIVQDVPVSFSQLHRVHGYRYKKEEIISGYEHDPMSEL